MSMAKPEKGEDPLAPMFPYVSVMNNVVYQQRANTAPGPVTAALSYNSLIQRTAATPLIGHLLWCSPIQSLTWLPSSRRRSALSIPRQGRSVQNGIRLFRATCELCRKRLHRSGILKTGPSK